MNIVVPDSVLTRPLVAGLANLGGAERVERGDAASFVVTETARFAAYPGHRMHLTAGISVRDRGPVALLTQVRADEVEDPVVWLREAGATAEVLARATLHPFFGFRPSRWVSDGTGDEAAIVVDELAALVPLEGGFREDLARAWFILTGMPLVTHLLAVPVDADPDEVDAVAAWFESGGGLDEGAMARVIDGVVTETGASREDIASLYSGISWTIDGEHRVSAAELFVKARVTTLGPIPWRV